MGDGGEVEVEEFLEIIGELVVGSGVLFLGFAVFEDWGVGSLMVNSNVLLVFGLEDAAMASDSDSVSTTLDLEKVFCEKLSSGFSWFIK